MRIFKRIFLTFLAVFVIAVGSFCLYLSDKYTVPIMMYHHVNDADPIQADTVSPKNFEDHMAFLKRHNFHVISMDELVEATVQKKEFPRKTVVITFDDAYEDNYRYAFPILRKYNFPAIIFAPSDFIGKEGYLTVAQLKEMMPEGIDIGGHTRTHTYLPGAPRDIQVDEIVNSKKILEKMLGKEIKHFAYPIGGFNEEVKQRVKETGYVSASTTNRGNDRFNKDVFELKRIRFGDRDVRPDIMWMKLSGFYNLFRKQKPGH